MATSDWFNEARFGMFVHWGAYAVAGRAEWIMNRELIPVDEYRKLYAENFRAEKYDPAAWAALAKSSGMKYIVLTTRHHDGFALWDTQTSDFNAARIGAKRDLVRPFVEAVRAAGLKVGFYYSGADWSHPDYPDAFARDWPQAWKSEASRQSFIKYYHAQIEELMTRYGKIDILWYDGCYPAPFEGEAINTRVKQWQPEILINERNGPPFDFRITERSTRAKDGPWEACLTLNDNWGWHAGDRRWKSPREVVRSLISTVAQGGNLLLNVGPKSDGTIPPESIAILKEVGQWVSRNNEFIGNSSRNPFSWNCSALVSTKGNNAYLHFFDDPGSDFCWGEVANRVLNVRMVDSGKPLRFEQRGERLFIHDLEYKDPIATSVKIELDGPPQPIRKSVNDWVCG